MYSRAFPGVSNSHANRIEGISNFGPPDRSKEFEPGRPHPCSLMPIHLGLYAPLITLRHERFVNQQAQKRSFGTNIQLDGSLTHLAVGELDTYPLPHPMGRVALLARCLPVRFQNPVYKCGPHSPVSSVDARSSFVASVAHCRLPRAPSAGVLSASWLGRQSCLRQTRIPCGSPKTTPPLPSNPTSPSAAGSRPHQSTHSFKRVGQNKLPNWATHQNTEIT